MTLPDKQRGKLPNKSNIASALYGNATHPHYALRRILDEMRTAEMPDIMQKMLDYAKKGDVQAMKFFLEREIPRDPAIHYPLPHIETPEQALRAMQQLTVDLGQGLITPTESQVIQAHIQTILAAIEMVEVDRRLKRLEDPPLGQLGQSKHPNDDQDVDSL